MGEIIDNKNERVVSFVKSLDMMIGGLERVMESNRPPLSGEIYLTDKELSQRLKVSRRTLQSWRDEGVVTYYQIGGKTLYAESEIQRLLNENRREAWR